MSKNDDKQEKIDRRRHLYQYRNMTDEEFETAIREKDLGMESSKELERRINEKLEQFSSDYDLSDLKINDKEVLRGLIQAIISLEDYEQLIFKIRSSGLSADNITLIDRMQKAMADIRKSISDAQNDLNITRKIRKSDQETSVIAYIDSLKEKARRFYESRMSYIFCPKCNTLLGTIWTLYPEQERNKIALVCNRIQEDGSPCGEKVVVGTKELIDNKGTNKKEVVPEAML